MKRVCTYAGKRLRDSIVPTDPNDCRVRTGKDRIAPTFEPRASWRPVEKYLVDHARADVLTILDTCSAGSAVKGSSGDAKVYEVLAAAGRESPTSAPGDRSYTRAMIDALKAHLAKSEPAPMTTFDLHQAIMRRRKCHASQLFSRNGHTHRFVKLAPLEKHPRPRVSTTPPRASFSLTLRFVFADSPTLTAEQAENLARALARGVAHPDIADNGLQAKAIDWVDFQPSEDTDATGDLRRLQEAVRKVQQMWRGTWAFEGGGGTRRLKRKRENGVEGITPDKKVREGYDENQCLLSESSDQHTDIC